MARPLVPEPTPPQEKDQLLGVTAGQILLQSPASKIKVQTIGESGSPRPHMSAVPENHRRSL